MTLYAMLEFVVQVSGVTSGSDDSASFRNYDFDVLLVKVL